MYASPTDERRYELWQNLIKLGSFFHCPWCLIGDFNEILSLSDKYGGRKFTRNKGLGRVLELCELTPLPFSGPKYAWSNGRPGEALIMERIDMVLSNVGWSNKFPEARVVHLCKMSSDHNPLLLQLQDTTRTLNISRQFKFLTCWLEHEDFRSFLATNWDDSGLHIKDALEKCASKLSWWGKNVFGNIAFRKKRCLARLSGTQQAMCDRPSTYLFGLEKKLSNELQTILKQEELYWWQKSKLAWITQGERNTRFFHITTIMRRRRNSTLRLKNLQGDWVDRSDALGNLVCDFYKNLYVAESNTNMGDFEILFPTLTESERYALNREVNDGEIYNAMFQLGAQKAPGIDGFSPVFFQYNWDVVGKAVLSFVTDTFRSKKFPADMNRTIITRIPKVDSPKYISQYRPITLMNVLIKVITKVVANRIKMFVAKLVSEVQCSFIPGRQTSDNIIIVQELLHSMRRMKGRTGIMAIKIDLEKAYDRISWPFLTKVLQAAGFSTDMVELIMYVVSSAKMQVLWNSTFLEEFQPSRGLRQGDPLAPFLFVLCMEHLTQLIQKSVNAGEWTGIRASRSGPPVSHLLFADDLFLFGKATEKQARAMAGVLEVFCRGPED